MPVSINFNLGSKKEGNANNPTYNPRSESEERSKSLKPLGLLKGQDSNSNLWEEAWQQVKQNIKWDPPAEWNYSEVTTEQVKIIQKEAQSRAQNSEKSQRYFTTWSGKQHTYREVFDNVAKYANAFLSLGDLVVQADPTYATLPWGLVRFVITTATSESQTYHNMLEGTEFVSQLINQYSVMEKTYARIDSKLSKDLREALLSFYVTLLKFQIRAITYFDKSRKALRTFIGLNPVSAADLVKLRTAVNEAKAKVDQNISLIHNDFMMRGIEELKDIKGKILTGQEEQLAITRIGILSLAQNTRFAIEGQTAFIQTEFVKLDKSQQKRMDIMMNEVINQWQVPLGSIMEVMMKAHEEKRVVKEQKKLAKIRRWLSVTLPDKDHDDARAKCRIVLGDWLFDHRSFVEWKTSPDSSILWVYGLAGTGKTNLSYRVIDSLQKYLKKLEMEQAHGFQHEPLVVDGEHVSVAMDGKEHESGESESGEPGYAVKKPRQTFLQAEPNILEDVPKVTQLEQASVSAREAIRSRPAPTTVWSKETSPGTNSLKSTGRLAFFYFSNDKAASGREGVFSGADPENAFRSIVSQLATAEGGKNIRIAKKLREYDAIYRRTSVTLNYSECADIILSIRVEEPVTIVIDAFDECDHGKCGELVDKLKEIIGSTPVDKSAYPVKVFITTRSFSAIEKDLHSDLSVEVTAENNRADVRKFIKETLQNRSRDILQGNASPELMEDIEDTLARRAQNMFLYASLHLQQLCDQNHYNDEDSIRKKLEGLPGTLTDVYDKIMEEIHDDKNNSARLCAIAQNTLRWLLQAQRPLECDVLLEAVSSIGEKAKVEEVIRCCRTLVVKENTFFGFAHYSVREYLQRKPAYNPSQCHLIATQSCLRILNTSFEGENANANLSDAQKRFSDYASLYWPVHYEGIETDFMDDRWEPIKILLRNFLLQGHGKIEKYEHWRKKAQKMADELGDKEHLSAKLISAKLKTLQAVPPTPLFAACVFGFPDIIGRFSRDPHGLNKCNAQGQSALSLAIMNKKLATVKALLSQRFPADVNLLNVIAVEQFDQFDTKSHQLEQLDQFDTKSPQPFIHYASPLQTAASLGFYHIAEYLIKEGANVDLVAGYYGSALQAAALHGHKNMVSLLLSKGAEPNSQCGYYGNALQAAAANGHVDVINLLLENKTPALISTPGGPFGLALIAAVCSGSSEAAWTIKSEESADPNVNSKIHGPLLEKAASMGYKEVVDLLLARDVSADLKPREKPLHILHHAAMHGMINLARHCLDKKCDVDMVTVDALKHSFPEDAKKMTPLSLACAEGQTEMVKFLLDHRASVKIGDVPAVALWVTVEQGHADIVDLLIERFEMEHGGKTALHEVVWAGDNYKPFLQHILEKAKKSSDTQRFKEFLNYRNEIGRTALRVAAEQNRPACVNLLISYNADWSIPGNAKVTALHAACREGHEAVFFLLLQAAQKAGPSQLHDFLDARDDEGRTALSDAVQRDRVKFVKILLGDGARCEIANVRDESALHHASFAGNEVMVMHLLEASSKDPGFLDAKTNQGKTALMNAAEAGSASIIKLLLDKGADYTLICNNGFTALHHCAVRNKRAAVKCLLEITSQDKFTDSDGQQCFEKFLNWQSRIIAVSALCDVAIQGHIEIIDLLLNKYGAAYDRVDSQKCSPLHHAYGRGHSAAAEIILRYAASDTDKQRFRRFVELRDFRDKTVWELAEERKDERWHQLMKECGAAP